MEAKKSIDELIRIEAFKNNNSLHNKICKELTNLSNKYSKFNTRVLAYCAVSKDAHKHHVFESGYKHYDGERAERFIKYCYLVKEKFHNIRNADNEKIAHFVVTYMDKFDDMDFFKKVLSETKMDGTKPLTRSTNVGRDLFANHGIFNDKGVLIGLKK